MSFLPMGYERRAVVLLALVLAADYADRTLVGAMGPTLKAHFHLSNGQLGFLVTAVNIGGAAAAIPIGMLVDRVSRTRLLAISVALWVVALIFVGLAQSFLVLAGLRLLLGAVTATSGPTIPSMVGDLVPSRRRSQALGYVDTGQLVGIGAGFLLAAFVIGFLTFRWGFWLLAGFGRIWLGATGYVMASLTLVPALVTRTLWVAIPCIAIAAFFLAGAGPPLDAVRVDVLVPGARGRAEAVRAVLRTVTEGAAPFLFGVLSGYLAGGGRAGLEAAFLVSLPALLLSGLVLLLALRSYEPDVAAALRSAHRAGSEP